MTHTDTTSPDPPRLSRTTRVLARVRGVARWTAIVIVLAFALIGFLQTTRGTAVRHVEGVAEDQAPVAVDEPHFPLAVTMLSGAWVTDGHRVEIMLDGDGTYPRLWEDLRSAQDSITLQIYYGTPGRMAQELAAILQERARAGVRVVLLYDAFGTIDIPADARRRLRESGVIVQPFRPIRLQTLHLAQNRSHVRGIVIDGRIGWTGGFGIDDKWYGDGRTNGSWRETNVRFTGPAVVQLQAAFATAWVEATGVLLTGRTSITREENGVTAGLLYTTPTLGSTSAERFMALSIAGARRSLYITNAYFAPDASFVDQLARAARSGVDVRILTSGPLTDVGIVRYAGRAWYETLLAAGVRLYEWQPGNLHAKTFVVDGRWVSIGSMNFDNRSMALNDEAMLMVLDEAAGARMDEIFFEDLQYSTEIVADQFDRRPWWQRIAETASNLVTRLL